jgi:hypothetical protein
LLLVVGPLAARAPDQKRQNAHQNAHQKEEN